MKFKITAEEKQFIIRQRKVTSVLNISDKNKNIFMDAMSNNHRMRIISGGYLKLTNGISWQIKTSAVPNKLARQLGFTQKLSVGGDNVNINLKTGEVIVTGKWFEMGAKKGIPFTTYYPGTEKNWKRVQLLIRNYA